MCTFSLPYTQARPISDIHVDLLLDSRELPSKQAYNSVFA